jgi:hypothetical protein
VYGLARRERTTQRPRVAARIAVVLVSLALVFGLYWLALGVVRGWMLPHAHDEVLWVIGPAHVLRFGACAVFSALTLPFVLRPLGRRWREQDQRERGTPIATHRTGQLALLIRGGLLFVVYAVCGLFYFASYGEVRDASITFHSPLGARTYAYDRITALHHFPPEGGQVDRYGIEFDDARWGYFDADCEGLDAAAALAIADHVSRHAGRSWTPSAR